LNEDVHLCPASTGEARAEITERKDNNRRKEGVKAGRLFRPSNVHMKATILVFYQRRELYNCAARYKYEKSHSL
jgi:hypothetical protein